MYRQLLADDRYKLVLEDLFKKKVQEKQSALAKFNGSDMTELVRIQTELYVFTNLLNNPAKFFAEADKIELEEKKDK